MLTWALVVVVAAGTVFFVWLVFLQVRSYSLQERRETPLEAAARHLGLEYVGADTFGLSDLPFGLLSMKNDRAFRNVMVGVWRGARVIEFDYSFEGGAIRYSCALTKIDASCPHLMIGHPTPETRFAHHLAYPRIEPEWEEFDRRFEVVCEDARFAHAFLDERMMAWLASIEPEWFFEVLDDGVLGFSTERDPGDLAPLLDSLIGFRGHVPRVIADLYPTCDDPTP